MTEETPETPEPSKGLGDTIEKIITKIGETTKIEYIRKKKGCEPCRKRKEWLNNAVPYQQKESTTPPTTNDCPDCEKKKKNCSRCNKK